MYLSREITVEGIIANTAWHDEVGVIQGLSGTRPVYPLHYIISKVCQTWLLSYVVKIVNIAHISGTQMNIVLFFLNDDIGPGSLLSL